MLTMKHNCPHCKTINSGFTIVQAKVNSVKSYGASKIWNLFFDCNNCGIGVICEVQAMVSDDPNKLFGDIKQNKYFHIVAVHPTEIAHDIPECLPTQVLNAFKEGVDNLPKSPNAASAMFRRSLEIGLKVFDETLPKMNLVSRIDILAEKGKITESLKDWAHQIRLDGNDALHEIEELTLDDAKQLHLFTKYTLVYLFTLPRQVEMAKTSKNQIKK